MVCKEPKEKINLIYDGVCNEGICKKCLSEGKLGKCPNCCQVYPWNCEIVFTLDGDEEDIEDMDITDVPEDDFIHDSFQNFQIFWLSSQTIDAIKSRRLSMDRYIRFMENIICRDSSQRERSA